VILQNALFRKTRDFWVSRWQLSGGRDSCRAAWQRGGYFVIRSRRPITTPVHRLGRKIGSRLYLIWWWRHSVRCPVVCALVYCSARWAAARRC